MNEPARARPDQPTGPGGVPAEPPASSEPQERIASGKDGGATGAADKDTGREPRDGYEPL